MSRMKCEAQRETKKIAKEKEGVGELSRRKFISVVYEQAVLALIVSSLDPWLKMSSCSIPSRYG